MRRMYFVPAGGLATVVRLSLLLLAASSSFAQVTLSKSDMNFGELPVSLTSPAQVVTFTNNGSAALSITAITISSNYTKSANCPKSLSAGASCTITVKFVPTTGGNLSGSLSFTDSDPTSPQTVALFGIGLAPGIRGAQLSGLTSDQLTLFNNGLVTFNIKWDPFRGLGPVFTQAACFQCHGGGLVHQHLGVSGDTSANAGTRFGKFNTDGTFNPLDGSGTFPENEGGPVLHPQTVGIFTRNITCPVPGEVVPADATVVSTLRSPQLFGDGLIDSIPEATILAEAYDKGQGVNGVANMVPDQNGVLHVGRFGQKSSFPNLLFFTLGAEFNELGITSSSFPVKHLPQGIGPIPKNCVPDQNNPQDVNGINAIQMYQFQALLGPVPTATLTPKQQAGKTVFENTGCNLCHVETMQTDPNATLFTDLNGGNLGTVTALANQTVALYSDLLLHDMGPGLSGGIPQGQASMTQWRTAPLWGVGTRLSFGLMHDMRATSYDAAIRAHGGEAANVVTTYLGLSSQDQSNLFAFLGAI